MLRASQFKLLTVQTVLFTPDSQAFTQADFLRHILARHAKRYDGQLQTFALPNDAPPELPRIVLQSKDGNHKLQAAPARIDALWIYHPDSSGDDALISHAKVLSDYLRDSSVRVGRVALVLNWACDCPNPDEALIEKFCSNTARETQFRGSRGFEIHNLKNYELRSAGRVVNSWVRCRTGRLSTKDNPTERDAVLLEQDINTPLEQVYEYAFTAESITEFFRATKEEAESILKLYFPEEVNSQ